MLAAQPSRAPRARAFPSRARCLALAALLLAILPAGQLLAQGGIVLEDGTYLEHDSSGGVVDPILGHFGVLVTEGQEPCGCEYGHYHGILFDQRDYLDERT